MPSTTLTIDQIVQSPYNVRTNAADADATAALEASILAHGLIEPIVVHPLEDMPNTFGAIAGGRRRLSIERLVNRGDLPLDWPVPVHLREGLSVAELLDVSLAENLLRKDLQDYEVFAAVLAMRDAGLTAQAIADRQGQTLMWVQQALRLGALAEPVFAALRDKRISIEQARAFGATEDLELQAAAFAHFAPHLTSPYNSSATQIRAWYRIEDRETEKLLRFIGVEVYRKAGGWYERDLFDDRQGEGGGRASDLPLLRRLADDKVATIRDATRTRVGLPELRFAPEPPRHPEFGGQDSQLYIQPAGPGENELPAGDVLAVIRIADDGEYEVSFWWASRKAMTGKAPPAPKKAKLPAGAAIGASSGYDTRRQADAAIKEEAGLTAEGTQILRSLRRALLRAALVQDAREGCTLGRDYLVWAQLRMQLSTAGAFGYGERAAEVGMRGISAGEQGVDTASVAHIDATEAQATWTKAIAELRAEPFLKEANLEVALLAFLGAPQNTRDLAAAVVAGLALERSLEADGYRVPVHDALAVQARLASPQAIRHWWSPTADFLELLPTAERRAIVEPFVSRETFAGWGKIRSAELTPLVLRVVQGTAPSTKRTQQLAAAQWVHPLLQFRRTTGASAGNQAEAAE